MKNELQAVEEVKETLTGKFEVEQRIGTMLSKATMVPDMFKNNQPNCIIAVQLASRMGIDPFMLMQNMYIVHGKPGIEGKLVIALINSSKRFSQLKFRFFGKKGTRDWGCIAYATEISTGETIESPEVTWGMVLDEKWNAKWKTMPELMFRYRTASFFAKTNCPEALMGMQTREELDDIVYREAKPVDVVNIDDVISGDVVDEPDKPKAKPKAKAKEKHVFENETKSVDMPEQDMSAVFNDNGKEGK